MSSALWPAGNCAARRNRDARCRATAASPGTVRHGGPGGPLPGDCPPPGSARRGVIPATAASASTVLCTRTVSINTAHGPVAVPGLSNGSDDYSLFKGDVSGGVTALQEAMKKCFPSQLASGFTVDGDFGSITKATLENVQRVTGASPIDGEYGPNTRAHMKFPSNDVANECFPL